MPTAGPNRTGDAVMAKRVSDAGLFERGHQHRRNDERPSPASGHLMTPRATLRENALTTTDGHAK